MSYQLRISVEMKDREITGPMLAQIVGQAFKDGGDVKDIVVICRSVNRGARADAKKYEASYNDLRITFIEDPS